MSTAVRLTIQRGGLQLEVNRLDHPPGWFGMFADDVPILVTQLMRLTPRQRQRLVTRLARGEHGHAVMDLYDMAVGRRLAPLDRI